MRTPKWLFDLLDRRFGPFVLDAAASHDNHLYGRYYTEDENGRERPWESMTFCNPPFKQAGLWVQKARNESQRGVGSVLILPVGCSQSWFQEHAPYATVFAPNKRISFDSPDGTPTEGADRDTHVWVFSPALRQPAIRVEVLDVR